MIKELMMQVGSALFAWAFLAGTSYLCAVWCFSYRIVWKHAARWATLVIGGFVVSLGLLYFVNAEIASIVTTIVVPAFICVIAFHTLLIALRRYLMQHAPAHVHTGRFYTTLAFLYIFFIGGSWLLIIVKSPLLTNCVELALSYFLYAAILVTFALTCLTAPLRS